MKKNFIVYILTIVVLVFSVIVPVRAQSANDLASCLAQKGWTMYGSETCPNCDLERSYFGSSFSQINYVNCTRQRLLCDTKGIHAYPAWEDGRGTFYRGAAPLSVLASVSGCSPNAELKPEKKEWNTVSSLTYSKQVPIALTAGLFSFFAPCCLPLFPVYFSVITGYTFAQLYGLEFSKIRRRVFFSSLLFVIGFIGIYTAMGAASSIIGKFLASYLSVLLQAIGIFLALLGLLQLGVIKLHFLEFDYAWNIQRRFARLGYVTALVTGIAAALSWIPCVGPLLAPILLLASHGDTVLQGSFLLFLYGVGLSLPFLLGGFLFPSMVSVMQKYKNGFHRLSQLAGIIMLLFGILLLIGKYQEAVDLLKQYINPIVETSGGDIQQRIRYLLKFSI